MKQTGHRGRVDGNHAEIVEGLRELGFGVQSLANVGDGCPDLCVSWRNVNCLIELKHGSKLTAKQQEWLQKWPGQADVVETLEQAVEVVTRHAKRMGVV